MDLNPLCTSLSISKALLLQPNKKHPSAPHSETTGGSAADGTALATQTYRAFSSNVTNTHRRQLPRGWWVLYPPPPCPWPCPDSTLPHSHSNPFPRVPTPTPPPHCPYWTPSLNPCLFPSSPSLLALAAAKQLFCCGKRWEGEAGKARSEEEVEVS